MLSEGKEDRFELEERFLTISYCSSGSAGSTGQPETATHLSTILSPARASSSNRSESELQMTFIMKRSHERMQIHKRRRTLQIQKRL